MIPKWNISGLLPPVKVGEPGHSSHHSPYSVTLIDLVDHFSTTSERQQILLGLLNYRKALHEAGLENGFQWLNGSFMEEIERTQLRAPNDIDVVSFFHLPQGSTQVDLVGTHANLFNPQSTKEHYKVDAYPAILGEPTDISFVKQIAYWYSMWSHTREEQWKGFLQIDLSPTHDEEARKILLEQINSGGIA